MNLQIIKNIHFTKLVKVNGRLREFNFRKVGGISGGHFHVDVPDDRGNRIMFRMDKENGQWRIEETPLPNWVTLIEEELSGVIEGEIG